MTEPDITERIPTARDMPSRGRIAVEIWVQRIGVLLLVALVIAALFGVFGPGTATTSASGAGGDIEVEYSSLTRPGLDSEVTVTFEPTEPLDTYVLAVDQSALADLGLEQIRPEPSEQYARGSRVVMEFTGSDADTFEVVLSGRTPTQQPLGITRWQLAWLVDGEATKLSARTVVIP